MIYLILSILCSTILGFIFKGFERYEIDTLQAIVVNYFVCVACATITLGEFPVEAGFWKEDWFPYAFFLGFIFISGFFTAATTVQKFGVTINAIMMKMSIVLSVSCALYLYDETINGLKILGILAALAAIILSNLPNKNNPIFKNKIPFWLWLLPFYTWVSSAIIEIVLQYVENRVEAPSSDVAFVAFLFGTAGVIGVCILTFLYLTGKKTFHFRNILGGIALGIPNFGSIYFLVKVLGVGWEGSVVFPVNNVAIIVLSSVLAYFFLQEKLSNWNTLGLGLAVISIILIAAA